MATSPAPEAHSPAASPKQDNMQSANPAIPGSLSLSTPDPEEDSSVLGVDINSLAHSPKQQNSGRFAITDLDAADSFLASTGPGANESIPGLEPSRSSMVSFGGNVQSHVSKPQVDVTNLQSQSSPGVNSNRPTGVAEVTSTEAEESPYILGQQEEKDALFFDAKERYVPTRRNSMEQHPMFNPLDNSTKTPENGPKRKNQWLEDDDQAKEDSATRSNGHDQASNHMHKHKAFVNMEHGRSRDPDVLAEAAAVTCWSFPREHPFRRWCFKIYKSPQANLYFMMVSVTNSLVIAIAPEFYETSRQVLEARWMLVFDLTCCCLFGFEVLIGVVALGQSWLLDDDAHRLEAFVLLAAIVEYVAESVNSRFATLRPFRLIRLFKPLSRVPGFSDIRRITGTLSEGVGQFSTVFAMLLIFLAAFGIFGMALFSSKFRNHCVSTRRGIPSCASDFSTGWAQGPVCNLTRPTEWGGEGSRGDPAVSGGYPFYSLCRIMAESEVADKTQYPYDPGELFLGQTVLQGYYHTCETIDHLSGNTVSQTCVPMGNPGSGFAHFDHFGGAMLAVAQIAVPDSQYLLLHWALESASDQTTLTWIMFFLTTCLCTFLLLSLFVAVVTGTFKRVREEQERQELANGPLIITQSVMDHIERSSPMHSNLPLGNLTSLRQVQRLRNHEEDLEFQEQVKQIVYHPMSGHFFHVVVVVDLLAIAADEHDSTASESDLIFWSHLICSLLLLGEMFMRFIASGNGSVFWRNSFHKFEVIVGLMGLIGLLADIELLELLPSVRMFRLMVYFPTLYQLLMSTLAAIPAILNLCLVICGVAICFAVTGRYVIDGDMNAYRSNFGSFSNAMLTIFQLLTGDSWSSVVQAAMETKDHIAGQIMSCLLLIAWFVFSKLIISNIFVSIIIENFDVSKTIDSIQEPGRIDVIRKHLHAVWFKVTNNINFRIVSLKIADEQFVQQPKTASMYPLLDHLRSNSSTSKDLATFEVGNVASNFASTTPAGPPVAQKSGSANHETASGLAPAGLKSPEYSRASDSYHSSASNGTHLLSHGSNENGMSENGVNEDRTVKSPPVHRGSISRQLPPPMTEGKAEEIASNPTPVESSDEQRINMLSSPGPLSIQAGNGSMKSPVVAPKKTKALGMVRGLTIKKLVQQVSRTEMNSEAAESDVPIGPEVTLGIFRPSSTLRRVCEWVMRQWFFDVTIGLAISVSCFIFIFTGAYDDTPVGEPAWPSASWRTGLNMTATIIFTTEFFIRIISQGLFMTKDAYFKDNWNTVDFLVLLFSWIDESGLLSQGQVAKVFRMGRALRPLRVMKRNEGMRVVLDALFATLAPVGYVLIFSMVNIGVFAIFGMGLFGGKLLSCSKPGAEYPGGKLQCVGHYINKESGVMFPRSWENPDYHFDTIFEAIYTLFRINTVKYIAVLENVMDITEIDKSPSINHSSGNAIYFVIFLVIGVLFIWNLLLGFIVDGFYAIRGKSPTERGFERFLRQLRTHRPTRGRYREPDNALAEKIRPIVDSRYFQWWSMTCVITNVSFMMAEHRNQSAEFSQAIDIQNIFFCVELMIECLLFGISYGTKGFSRDLWKAFDLFIACGTFVGAVAQNPSVTQPANAFRLFRVLRLMAMFSHIRIILETLLASLPQLGNILLLLFLIYSMFAVVAVEAFGKVKFGKRLGPTASFETWVDAMKVCYQMVVGDEWQDLMTDSRVQYPRCTIKFSSSDLVDYHGPELAFGDCGTPLAPVFFILFKLLCEAMMLNLFIGMILDNFSFITDEIAQEEDDNWSTGASAEQIKDMVKVFRKYDAGTGYLPLTAYRSLAMDMPMPLGFRHNTFNDIRYGKVEKTVEKLMLAELHLVVRSEREEMKEVLEAWWRRGLNSILPSAFQTRRRFFHAVAYEEVMLTMFYWRKPDMVPDDLKLARIDRIQEVILMTYAITLKNFFSKLVAKKKRERVQNGLTKLASKEDVFKGPSQGTKASPVTEKIADSSTVAITTLTDIEEI